MFEQEVEQMKEQNKIKEANYEEEIQILKAQVLDGQRHTASENIQLIQLHKDNNIKTAQCQTLKAQVEGMEEQLKSLKKECELAQMEAKDLANQLNEEQKKTIQFSQQLTENTSSKQALVELEEKAKDLKKENAILRESNNKLLDSAYSLERERHYQASENALKVQVAQLESTLKSDLQDKKALQDALFRERENYAKMEAEYQDLQAKYFDLKGNVESQQEKMQFFAKENSVNLNELEDALLLLRHKKDEIKSIPSFLDEVTNDSKDIKHQLSELQVQHVEAINELEKTRSLLRVQGEINSEQKKEVEALQSRYVN